MHHFRRKKNTGCFGQPNLTTRASRDLVVSSLGVVFEVEFDGVDLLFVFSP
jgi:hypothetical protein